MPHIKGLTKVRTRSHANKVRNFLHYGRQPQKVWSGDITWMPGPALGVFFYLYL